MTGSRAGPGKRIMIGRAAVDSVSFAETVDRVRTAVREQLRLVVFTCNVDHVVQLERDVAFRQAYAQADLVTADGGPLVGLSRLLRTPLPGRVTGADLAPVLARVCAEEQRTLALIGGAPGVGFRAAELLQEQHSGLSVVVECPSRQTRPGDDEDRAMVLRLTAAAPAAYLVCLGAPKQELWIARLADDLPPGVFLGAGAALDFIAGVQRRAPRVVQAAALEFLWRLATDAPRLWRRYLVRDLAFGPIAWQTLRRGRQK